jgi:hypothetical protein
MTKPLDPEVKALRALHRALRGLKPGTQLRVLNYWVRRIQESALAASDISAFGGHDNG